MKTKIKTLIITLFLILVTSTNVHSQEQIKVEQDKYVLDAPKEYLSSEFGLVFGTPGTINLNYAKHFGGLLMKVSGMYLANFQGAQLDVGYKVYLEKRTYQAITIAGGMSRFPQETALFAIPLPTKKWDYVSINYLLNTQGFLFSLGLSAGEGDFTTPQFMFQIGFSSQFWE